MWQQIRGNRRRSAAIVAGMGVLLVLTGMGLGALAAPGAAGLLLGGAAALLVWLLLWLVSGAQGDDILLRVAGAREIRKADHPQLWNVVEEMTIAANLDAPPRVFVMEDPAPNAFATGKRPDKAAVAVTTGLLRAMNRDELQGVVAHEIGHIRNRDVALMTTAGIMLGAIVLLAEAGRRALFYGGRAPRASGRRSQGAGIALVVVLVLMILAPLLAQLIYLALSRRREYLADASAALFTRYPDGLASALEKIGRHGGSVADRSLVTAPMYIAQPRAAAGGAASLFATHPPLAERIRILRSMGGRADLGAYERAAQRVTGRTIVPLAGAAAGQEIPAREAAAPEGAGPAEEAARARTASDAFLAAAGYERRACTGCAALVKLPPALRDRVGRCPRCGAPLAPLDRAGLE